MCSNNNGNIWRETIQSPGFSGMLTQEYRYDGIGRTLTVTAPDGSVTHYSYAGNQTTVTDPAGKWKTQTKDALGNLVQVTEPNPAGGANFVTSYAHDGMNHLTGVTLTRPEGTQTRTFNYGNGPDLLSATNPENGTVTYAYNNAHQVLDRTDAKNQQTQYSYDAYGRLSEVRHYTLVNSQLMEDPAQRLDYYYDTPIDPNYGATYTWGHLTGETFGYPADQGVPTFEYEYGYNPAGRVTMQRMVASFNDLPLTYDATYAWDNEGRLSSRTYPEDAYSGGYPGPSYSYQYDLLGRLNGITQNGSPVASAAYGPAGEMTSLAWLNGYSETRTYNNLLQLTRQTVPGVFDTEYLYPAGQNNGQISSEINHLTGQQVNYTYDPLKRLTAAGTVGPGWGQAYTYDGFGNMTSSTVTQGSGVNWNQAYDPATNRMIANPAISYDANGNTYSIYDGRTYDVENRMNSGAFGYWYL